MAIAELKQNLAELWPYLTDEEKRELDLYIMGDEKWAALQGPQSAARDCLADELFYGGSAGGGKSDLLCGLGVTEHRQSIIYRRESTQLIGLVQRCTEILGSRDGYNGQANVWQIRDGDTLRILEFGSVKDPDDVQKYQGRPHDLKGFDEITHFLRDQYIYLNGWKRTAHEGQRVRTLCTGNPPKTPEGRWVINYWGPWLDRQHPLYNKVEPGELVYFWYDDNGVEHYSREPDPVIINGEETIPKSRSFIPSSVEDNPFYMATGYKSQLQALPEPLRSQLLKGDFSATGDDDPMQVIPTEWIEQAMARWTSKEAEPKGVMDSMGVDPARGGRDHTIMTRRHGYWFDKLIDYPGGATPDGPTTAGLVVGHRRDDCPVHVDIIGIGSSVGDFLRESGVHMVPVNGAEGYQGTDKTGTLRFVNMRAWIIWSMREALDPQYDEAIALPQDDELLTDLASYRFKVTRGGIQIESKDEIKKRIGRSPDRGDAVCYGNIATPKRKTTRRRPGEVAQEQTNVGDYDPIP